MSITAVKPAAHQRTIMTFWKGRLEHEEEGGRMLKYCTVK
jgi:hypothetical protein